MSLSKLTRFIPIPFSTWSETNEEDLRKKFESLYGSDSSQFKANRCNECQGDGLVVCDRGHEHDCPECNGSGDGPSAYELFKEGEYDDQLHQDKERVKRYLAKTS